MYQVKVLENTSASKVQQIVSAFMHDIDNGLLKKGDKLPTINQFSENNGVARDTIEKAYKRLRSSGYIASYPSRGYFVLGRDGGKLKVLLVFNKLSSFKKIIYDAILDGLGKRAKVDLCIHHYSPQLLKEILEANRGRYDYYAVMPHFYTGAKPEECKRILELVPPHELILLDKRISDWEHATKLVYQDFKNDIYEALGGLAPLLRKYKKVMLLFPENTNHPKEIIKGIEDFCSDQKKEFAIIAGAEKEPLSKHGVYIAVEEEDLAQLIKKVRRSQMVLGRDIGIISFNETVFKELLDITVVTTDFEAMGRTTADLILGKRNGSEKNPFYTIHRGSL